MEDESLVADALENGPEAFAPIVRRYQSAVFSVALSRIRDYHEAEDVAQAVFVDAFLHLDGLKDTARLGPWLRTMAINKGIDWLRRRRDHVDIDVIANDLQHAAIPALLQEDDRRDQVMMAIGRLGTAQRETITLHYLGGYSVQEIADIQGAPVGTVKTRLHHGRRALKRDVTMVETTLTSQQPSEDLAQRVFDALSRHNSHGEIYQELRELGAGKAIEGFARAAASQSPEMRRQASYYAASFAAEDPAALDVVKAGFTDPNRHVRRFSVMALLHLQVSDEVMRREFLPLAMDLLFDSSLYVRQRVCGFLEDWCGHVPLETAARALLEETHAKVRPYKEALLRAVLAQQSGGEQKVRDHNFIPAHQMDQVVDVGASIDERIASLREALRSQTTGKRTRAVSYLLRLAMRHPERTREIVDLVVGALADRAKRVRWRAGQELRPWAAEIDATAVERALSLETNAKAKKTLEALLEKVKEQQSLKD